MEMWQAVILGLVEGITEYLPISSTGHLILAKEWLGLGDKPEMAKAVDDFIIVIQGGAILAVLGLYWQRAWQMVRGLCGKDPAGLKLVCNLFVAFLPAAIFGLLLDKWIESKLFFTGPVIAALFLGGVFMMLVEAKRDGRIGGKRVLPSRAGDLKEIDQLTAGDALAVGLLQCIAMWPGTSRSMMTIVGGYLVGLRPKAAAEFSFLLGLPTLGAATLYKLAKNLKHSADTGEPNMFEVIGWPVALVGIGVAAISAAVAVKWLVGFLNKHGLVPFGWYRIVLAIVLGVLIWRGVVEPIGGSTVKAGGSAVVPPVQFVDPPPTSNEPASDEPASVPVN